MMDDPEISLTVLNALRDAGFTLSIDDFGTGYSSLSYLQRVPVAGLKIDRSFVRNVWAGTDGTELLDSIISLRHRMGLSVVAEGAETAQECALLQSLGCDYVQGWFVAKAMPVPEFDQWRQCHDPFVLNTA
ncbi:MAG: EAL domain-containing protein [Candidatus Saccharibacteria bacterium]|nr:EAL domain-containing protein [Rhodoferax sp.]